MEKENKPRTAVIYARYSSHAQRDVSIEQQIDECTAYAKREGIDVLRIYADHAISGTSDDRPQFQLMLHDAAHAKWDYVICYKVDRFARNRYDSATYKYKLKKAGTKVLYAKEAIPEGPEGVLLEAVLEGSAEYYSQNLAQNVRRGLAYNAANCFVNGRTAFGYKKGPDHKLMIEPAEADLIRELFRRVAAGEPMRDIVRNWNARGFRTRNGKEWSYNSLQHILRNRTFVGVYTYDGKSIEGGAPRIVDDETFEAVQDRLKTYQHKQSRQTDGGEYLLTGKLFCGLCGERMVGTGGTGRHGESHFYYSCNGRIKKKSCKKETAVRDQLETLVVQTVVDVLMDDNAINQIADAAMRYQEAEAKSSKLGLLESSLAAAKKRHGNLLDAIEQGVITPGVLGRLKSAESEIAEIEFSVRMERANLAQIPREALVEWLLSFRSGDTADPDFRRHIVDAFISKIYLYDDKFRVVLNFTGSRNTITADLVRTAASDDAAVKGFVLAENSPAKLILYEPHYIVIDCAI